MTNQSDKSVLQPCPFCGRADPVSIKQGNVYCVYCPRCNTQGPSSVEEQTAIGLWNKNKAERARFPSRQQFADWLSASAWCSVDRSPMEIYDWISAQLNKGEK